MTRFVIVLAAAALVGDGARAQEKKEIGGTSVKAGASMGDAHKERLWHSIANAASPGPEHKLLMPLVGKWNTEAKQWLGGPHPETTTGHSVIKSILGGRFVEEHYDSVIFGKPYQAESVIGYDTRAKKFVSTWIDTWGTWITVEEGSADSTGKVITMTAQDYDVAGGKTRPIKFVYTIDGNDHHVMRVYETIQGKETLTMEVDYKKTK